jgi:peptidyl-prolyl cis-trans isomerase D
MGVILGLIAVSFGIWGIGDMFQGTTRTAVATVGGSDIRTETFRQLYQDRLQQLGRQIGRPILPDQARALGIDRQLLGQVIAETVLDQKARAMRLRVSDTEAARQVTDDPNFKGINGQFDRARFEAVIRNAGYTEARFLDEQRRTMLRQQLVGTVGGETVAPKLALEAFNRFQNEERSIDYVALGPAQAGDIPDPAADVLAKYFEERKVAFRAPEFRKLTVVSLTPDELAAHIEVSDADVRKSYDDRRVRYETPERRHLKQIVFPNIDEAKAAEAKLAAGTTFEALATERGLKDSDIDLGTVARTAVVDRDVGDAAFKLKAGEISPPIEGRFGVAIVKVEAIEPAKTRPFEEVAAEIKREIATDRARNELINVQEKVEDERLSGATLAEAARKSNLKPRIIEAISNNGNGPDGKPVTGLPEGVDVLSAAFNAEVDGENEPLRLPNRGGYVWYNVDAVTPARDRPLDEVKDQVIARWRNDQIAQRLEAKAKEMLDKIKAGTSFADVVAAEKLKTEWRPGIKRGNPPAGLTAAAVTAVFRTAQGESGSVEGASPTERLLFRVTEAKVPPLDPQSAEAKRLEEALRSRNAEDLVAEYVAKLQADAGVTINQNALNQAVGGSSQNF